MKNAILLFAIFLVSQLQAQTPLTGTNWYLTKIEENNQVENVPISSNGSTGGNWHLYIVPPVSENIGGFTSTYCSSFIGPINITSTGFSFSMGQISLTLNMPCEWMTTEEIQYFSKYYNFYENYRNDTFTYLIQNYELVITNKTGNKAYYSNAPLSNKTFEKLDKEIILYPNPATSELFIKLSENEQLNSVKIFNTEGKEVRKAYSTIVDISYLSSGIYFLEIEISGIKYNRKFIKK